MISIRNILRYNFHSTTSSSSYSLSSLFINAHDPGPTSKYLISPSSHCFFTSSSLSTCISDPISTIRHVNKVTFRDNTNIGLFPQKRASLNNKQLFSSFGGSDKTDKPNEEEEYDLSGDQHDGPNYPDFADKYRQKAELLKKNLSRIQNLDKLFEMVYDNIDYVGRFNCGVLISRLSHLTDPRVKNHSNLTREQIDFLTKLVLINHNILEDTNLISLVAITMSHKLPYDHNLTITTLQEIRRRLKDLSNNHLIWLWKQSGYMIKSSDKAKEWFKLRDSIINVVERRVNDFSYDFQNVSEISSLTRILLTRSSSVIYLHRLLKNMSIFTDSIDYGLAWDLIVQLTPPVRRVEKIGFKDLETIYTKCYQVIQEKLYENNFQLDNYIEDYFFNRIVESPESIPLTYDRSFFKALHETVDHNQKFLGTKGLIKCAYFFGCNRYYPNNLLNKICSWIKDHPDEYLRDTEYRPNFLMKLFSESRYFENKPDEWKKFSKLLLDPVKISCLSQNEKFRILSYLMIMGDYNHLTSFCPEFEEICEHTKLQRHFWRAFHHIYAGLSRDPSTIGIEGQLIKRSMEKYLNRARRAFHFIDKSTKEGELDELLTTLLGDRHYFGKRIWTNISVLLNYVIVWDKQGNLHQFNFRGKNNVALIEDLINDLENHFVLVLFPIDGSHYCHEPPILRGQFIFKLSMIKHLGFIPIMIDRQNWNNLNDKQKISILKREIETAKDICFGNTIQTTISKQ